MKLACKCAMVVVVLLCTSLKGDSPNLPSEQPAIHDAVSFAPMQVRLRKLHLVRPDLIQYPIMYEVCC